MLTSVGGGGWVDLRYSTEITQRTSKHCLSDRCCMGKDAQWQFRGLHTHGILPWSVETLTGARLI